VLEPRLPPAIFYNLLVSARAPASGGRSQIRRVNGSALQGSTHATAATR
jgi:hypothetical protein